MNEELLRNLEQTPDRLANEIDELSEGELVKRPPDGGWNLKELAGHMVDVERLAGNERLTRIMSEEEPFLPAFDQEEQLRDSRYGTAPIGDALAEWKSWREQNVAMLRGLTAEDMARTGRHEELGPLTPVQIAESLARHDEQHLAQALELKGLSREPSS